jgi:hypothetical protein
VFAFSQHTQGNRVVILDENLPEGVKVGGVWGLRSAEVNPQYFSVVGVEEVEKHKFSVTGLEYHQEIFAEVDDDVPYSEESIAPDLDWWRLPQPVENLLLHTSSKIDQGITVHTLTVSWERPSVGFGLEYEVWLQKGLGNYQYQTSTRNTSVSFRLTEADNYCVRIVTVGLQGRRATPVEACLIVGSIEGDNEEIISGLEIKGKGNITTFETGDVEFDWRVNYSGASSELQSGEVPILPPNVSEYLVKFYDTDSVLIGEYVTTESYFNLTRDRNAGLTDGPHREFIVAVQARTTNGALSAITKIRVSNPAPNSPTSGSNYSVTADTDGNAIIRVLDPSLLPADFAGIRVWLSQSSGFTPTDSIMREFVGTQITLPLVVGVTNYIRFAYFDLLSSDSLDCNISDEIPVVPVKEGRLSAFDFIHFT